MKLAIVADETIKNEWVAGAAFTTSEIIWIGSVDELPDNPGIDVVLDLLFERNSYKAEYLKDFLPKPVIVSSVIKTIGEIGFPFVRINGWPTFNNRKTAELSINSDLDKKKIDQIFEAIGKKTEWVPDVSGFVSARVISMIINEAFFALGENVSTKEEIDTAMKLGTNYPFGPFEWAEKIGLKNIRDLLIILSEKEKRYQPSALLIKEAWEK